MCVSMCDAPVVSVLCVVYMSSVMSVCVVYVEYMKYVLIACVFMCIV